MINYIEIKGYKSIKDINLALTPINVLIGANGAGKSNFISFFDLLDAIFKKQFQQFTLEQGGAEDLMYFGTKHTEKIYGKVVFQHVNSEYNNAYFFQLKNTQSGTLFIKKEGSGYNIDVADDSWNYFHNYDIKESELDTSTYGYRDYYLGKYLEGIQIFHFHDTSPGARLRQPSDLVNNHLLKPDGRNLPAFLYKIKQQEPIIYKRILRVIQSVAPFIHDFELIPNDYTGQEKIALRWIDKGDRQSSFSVFQLSDGTLRFIALTVALMQPNPPSIIIIDEPELGLHHFAIKKLTAMIEVAAQKSQIIVSTQSINLMNEFTPEQIITVDRENDQSIFRRLKKSELQDWLEDYSMGYLWQNNIIHHGQPK